MDLVGVQGLATCESLCSCHPGPATSGDVEIAAGLENLSLPRLVFNCHPTSPFAAMAAQVGGTAASPATANCRAPSGAAAPLMSFDSQATWRRVSCYLPTGASC